MADLIKNRTFIDLPIMACGLLDFPVDEDGSNIDCSIVNTSICVRCDHRGRFITEEGIDDVGSLSHIICIVIWILTLLIGTIATSGNFIIITVIRKRRMRKGFDRFLIGLASCDLVYSVVVILASTSFIIFSQNWNRGAITQFIYLYSTPLVITAHSAATFVTVVITIERYLVIAFPENFGQWFTPLRTKLVTASAIALPLLLGVLRLSCFTILPNVFVQNVTSIGNLEYIIMSTPMYDIWYSQLHGFFDAIDICLAFPTLLFFNVLVYYHIRRFATQRKELNSKLLRDIRAARIFLPVVLTLFICNIIPFIHYYFLFNRVIYRDAAMGTGLSYVVNAAVNLPIYYFGGTSFRKETKIFIARCFPCLGITASEPPNEAHSKVSASRSIGNSTIL